MNTTLAQLGQLYFLPLFYAACLMAAVALLILEVETVLSAQRYNRR